MADLTDLATYLVRRVRDGLTLAVAAEVVSYDASGPTADVRPLVTVDGERPPVVSGCPVQWPNAGGRALTWGLVAGDRVTLLVRSQSHDEVDDGRPVPVTPALGRRHSLADAVVQVGYTTPGTLDSDAYRNDGQPVLSYGSGEALHLGASTADKALALAYKVRDELDKIDAAFSSHTHQVTYNSGTAGPLTTATAGGPTYTPADVDSTRVKTDDP